MKRIALILALLAFALSPLMVSQANAAPVKHHHRMVKHHRKLVKKRAVKRLGRRSHHKANA